VSASGSSESPVTALLQSRPDPANCGAGTLCNFADFVRPCRHLLAAPQDQSRAVRLANLNFFMRISDFGTSTSGGARGAETAKLLLGPMRFPAVFGPILVAGTLLSGTLSAQHYLYVNRVFVRNSAAIAVEIRTTGTVTSPNTQAITGPDRIVVDFPGALPASELHALKVNRGPLKGIRSALFFDNPPITRIVLDLTSAQTYQISRIPNGVVVTLTGAAAATSLASARAASDVPSTPWTPAVTPKISAVDLTTVSGVVANPASSGASSAPPMAAVRAPAAVVAPQAGPPREPPTPIVNVSFHDGMLQIHAEKATLAEVLSEIQRQTQAEIDIPAGAEQEQIAADLGPAPVRDVLAALLNGSNYNFIFVGGEQSGSLGKVILSRQGPSF
jgi:hypothetical protein